MLPLQHDTIVAVATAPGRGAIGIVRASGPHVEPLIAAICGAPLEARRANYLPMRGADGHAIDHGLAIYFRAPHSYTGEDVLELQVHGGPVVLQLLLARCLEAGADHGARVARPGEFTQRAFLNGKLDLAQAEAVSDLIEASTEAAARSAALSLSGSFSAHIDTLSEHLVELRALVEATLDFPDEEVDFLKSSDAHNRLTRIGHALDQLLLLARQGVLLRDGIKVVLAGQPNVGKSSLLNALAGAELAIVTPVPGTTRDKVSETIQIEGVPIHVIDTAGLRDSTDAVERIGIERTWGEISSADLVIFLHDLTRAKLASYAAAEAQLAQRLAAALARGTRLIHVYNKSDAIPEAQRVAGLNVSALTAEGLPALRRAVLETAGWQLPPEGVFLARARHVHALRRAAVHVAHADAHAAHADAALELLAEELRLAHLALAEITGAYAADDLLGQIFSRFCIGK
ncbi:MAG: tRNA uridine-5-carboxymethylaminomethyl(34) synthesis GTPase MnmE [Burkholderiaceae bacterium]